MGYFSPHGQLDAFFSHEDFSFVFGGLNIDTDYGEQPKQSSTPESVSVKKKNQGFI